MILRPAGNTTIQQAIARNQDVRNVVRDVESDWQNILPMVASVIRGFYGKSPTGLEEALQGYRLVLEAAELSSLKIDEVFNSIRNLYGNSRDDDDVNRKRGKILEILAFDLVKRGLTHFK